MKPDQPTSNFVYLEYHLKNEDNIAFFKKWLKLCIDCTAFWVFHLLLGTTQLLEDLLRVELSPGQVGNRQVGMAKMI